MFSTYFLPLISLSFLFSSTPITSQPDTNVLPLYPGHFGEWKLLQRSVGISAMHMQLLHNNKVVMFDRTDFGRSNISLPGNRCRRNPEDIVLKVDCTAHSVLYDPESNTFRPLMVQTDTWCSSGAVLPNGTLVQTGGFNDGDRTIRSFTPCDDTSCDWIEHSDFLTYRRWYATNQILPDGRIFIVGGRREFNYEFYPRSSPSSWSLPFLSETRDGASENNLYPFVHLLPDGNLFIFANTRSISLDYKRNRVVKEFPRIPGNVPRNYPSTGSSVLLPIDDNRRIEAEIMICGGAPRASYEQAQLGNFRRATSTCGRIRVTDQNPRWVIEEMPMARVMSDMILLPTGDVIIVNGAEFGTAGWELGHSPLTRPVIYRLTGRSEWKFSLMAMASRPRMYHSTAILLADGRILVGGSNPHIYYNFTGVDFPTDLSLEAFSPPYLSTEYDQIRPTIMSMSKNLRHGGAFSIRFRVTQYMTDEALAVTIIQPSFNTHSTSMNQRMVVLTITEVDQLTADSYSMTAVEPSAAEIAPPGYYMLFVVHAGIPSRGTWVKIQ